MGTALTVLASYFDLGEWHIAPGLTLFWNPVVALAIATTKMMLVVLFFMHVKYSPKLTKLTVASGLFMFLVLIGMTLADYSPGRGDGGKDSCQWSVVSDQRRAACGRPLFCSPVALLSAPTTWA